MQTAAEYRERALECVELSRGKPLSEKVSYLTIAAEWLKLAHLADLQESFEGSAGETFGPSTDTTH